MDYRAVFRTQAKWVTEIDQVDRIPEIISRAFHVATSGRPGPVVIALPEDMLVEYAEVADAPHYEVLESAATAQQMDALAAQLANARQPTAILGGTRWNHDPVHRFAPFAARHQFPVAAHFPRPIPFSPPHPPPAG